MEVTPPRREIRARVLRIVEQELEEGLCAGGDATALQRYAHIVIDLLVGAPIESLPRAIERELRTVAAHARQVALVAHADLDVRQYAIELRLVRAVGGELSLSPLGRILLGVPQPDAIPWLLLLETKQSMGEEDGVRMSSALLHALLYDPDGHRAVEVDEEGHRHLLWPWYTLAVARLQAFGVAHRHDPSNPHDRPYIIKAWRPLLEEIASHRVNPWRLLADTLLAEERDALPISLPQPPRADDGALALQRHARMVAHEIQNAMTPVQHGLLKLYDALAHHAPDAAWRTYQERVDRNIDRTVRFAEQMAAVASLAAAPQELFAPSSALTDALAEINGGFGDRVTLHLAEGAPKVRGHRHRFVMALVNLLRNAAQAATDHPVRVVVSSEIADEQLRLTIDDDGPGVPVEYREAIFQPNFKLRAEGHGHGLSLVRDVIEGEMGGSIRCEASDSGGARFVVLLPLEAPGETP